MAILRLLWLLSWFMAAIAVAWMLLLIVTRLLRDAVTRRSERIKAEILQAYMGLMHEAPGAAGALGRHEREPKLLAEALLEILDIVKGGERVRLVEALAALHLDRLLRKRVRKGPSALRLAAVEALATFPGEANELALRRLEKREPVEIRLAAAKSLAAMGLDVDVGRLLDDMTKKKEPLGGGLAETLRLVGERRPEVCAALLEDRQRPAAVRAMAADALGAAGDYRMMASLAAAAMNDVPVVRAACLLALGRLMHPASEPVVARAFRDPDWRVRSAAVKTAGVAGFFELVPGLAERLADPVWSVRFEAAEALARLGPDGATTLRVTARNGSDAAAQVASLTLAERGLG